MMCLSSLNKSTDDRRALFQTVRKLIEMGADVNAVAKVTTLPNVVQSFISHNG